jgi:hypothetical protein
VLSWCDYDFWPVGGDLYRAALAALPRMQKDPEVWEALLEHEHLSPDQELSRDELIAIYQLYKQQQRINLTVLQGFRYRFRELVYCETCPTENEWVSGMVNLAGGVIITAREPGVYYECPICLAVGVRIATPSGEVAVEEVREGTEVWTADARGERVRGRVIRIGSTPASTDHEIVRLALADGREILASPGHPSTDGRRLGDLRAGDLLDGSRVVLSERIPYEGGRTYDLLPDGPSGTYIANGIRLRSTLTLR